MLKVPKNILGISENSSAELSFKWADNYIDGDIMSFYSKGDSAPYGRLNYYFS